MKSTIHPFSILSIHRSGRGGAGAYPSGHNEELLKQILLKSNVTEDKGSEAN